MDSKEKSAKSCSVTAKTRYFSTIAEGKIDRANGVISGVSVVTEGEAKGWGIKIDHKTLETVLSCAKEFSSGVKVKFRHKMTGEFQSVVDEVAGVLKNFSIDGNKLRADFHFLKSLPAETKEKVFEMAEVMPDQFGFSIVFSGVSEEKNGHKFARCSDLLSTDLSDNPAANPDGLFEQKPMSKEIKYEAGDKGKHSKDCECDSCSKSMSSDEIMQAFSALTTTVTALAAKVEAKPTIAALTAKDGKTLSADDIMVRLEAADKFVADARKSVETAERSSIIKQLSAEGRVIYGEDNVAMKLEELEKMELPMLKFAARNSQIIPTIARSVFTGTGKGPQDHKGIDGKPLKGSELTSKAWESDYGDLNKMLETPVGQTVQN